MAGVAGCRYCIGLDNISFVVRLRARACVVPYQNIRGQGQKRITIRTSALEEKATACSMLRAYAQELGEAFLPYVQDVARVLVPLIRFQYMDDVRSGAMSAMPELLKCSIKAVPAGMPGASLELVTQLRDFMFEPIIEQLKNEPDTETLGVRQAMLEMPPPAAAVLRECVPPVHLVTCRATLRATGSARLME